MKISALFLKHATKIVALTFVVFTFLLCQQHEISAQEKGRLASQFQFTKFVLPDFAAYPHKSVRQVNKSLAHLSAWVSATGAAIALADIDGDGLPNDYCQVDPRTDLVIVGPVPGTGKRYEPFVLKPQGIAYDSATTCPSGALIGDVNEDGLQDVIVYFWGRAPIVYLQVEHGKSLSAGSFICRDLVKADVRWYTDCAALTDLDGDGHPDLVFGNYCADGARTLDARAGNREEMYDSISHATNGGCKHFLLFDHASQGKSPDVCFKEVKTNLPEDVLCGWTTALATFDLNGDLKPDIYLANDVGPDRLLLNKSTRGKLKFAVLEGKRDWQTPKSCVLGKDSFKGMGVDICDINQDGRPDIYVSNIASRYKFLESHLLFVNNGAYDGIKNGIAPFSESADAYGLSQSGWAWDCRFADFNNDGSPEMVQAIGFMKGAVNRWPDLQALSSVNDRFVHDPRFWPSFKPGADISGNEGNAFFVKADDGKYYNISKEVGLSEPMLSRGIAVADVDGDGDLDFVVANQWQDSYFYRNDSKMSGKFLGLNLLIGCEANDGGAEKFDPALGAQATLYLPSGKRVISQVDCSTGHSGKNSPQIFFGLGNVSAQTRLKVDLSWRDRNGRPCRKQVQLAPGWHTLELG